MTINEIVFWYSSQMQVKVLQGHNTAQRFRCLDVLHLETQHFGCLALCCVQAIIEGSACCTSNAQIMLDCLRTFPNPSPVAMQHHWKVATLSVLTTADGQG